MNDIFSIIEKNPGILLSQILQRRQCSLWAGWGGGCDEAERRETTATIKELIRDGKVTAVAFDNEPFGQMIYLFPGVGKIVIPTETKS